VWPLFGESRTACLFRLLLSSAPPTHTRAKRARNGSSQVTLWNNA
jgi:hypothetical protein